MANNAVSAPLSTTGSSSKFLRFLSRVTWYELLAIPIIAVVAAIFFVKEAITEAFWTAQERSTMMMGVGMMPLGVWAGVFVAALVFKPGLFRHYRLWLASALLLALTFGLLSLFRPLEGSLAWFTLGGYVSLGGLVGETIAGPVLWQRGNTTRRSGNCCRIHPISGICSFICNNGRTAVHFRLYRHCACRERYRKTVSSQGARAQ